MSPQDMERTLTLLHTSPDVVAKLMELKPQAAPVVAEPPKKVYVH
jgi:hypothetical protein